MNPVRKFLAIAFLFLAFTGGAILLFHGTQGMRAEVTAATVLPEPMPLPDFSLTDQGGRAFTRDALRGRWHLVFFGFTNCPDICPATLQQLAIARQRVLDSGRDFPGIVLISVDPERDTVEALSAYTGHFGADIKGITGDLEELRRLTGALGIYFARSGDPAGDYSVDHSAAVLLLNDKAEWHAVFSAPQDIDAFVHDVPILTGAG